MDGNLLKLSAVLLVMPLLSCSSLETNGITVASQWSLDDQLPETSGLFCDASGIYSINDSGNPAVLFKIVNEGAIQQTSLPLKNKDWESVTASSKHFYIADIGNNNGTRKDLVIYKLERQSQTLSKTLSIQYKDNVPNNNLRLAHDFDAEAVTFANNKLVLFSKSWKTKSARVYLVDTQQQHQVLAPIKTIDSLPGMITGVDYDPVTQEYIVVGYEAGSLGLSAPFLAILNKQFELVKVLFLKGYGQVEGVCIHQDHVWFSQEKTALKPAQLVKLKLH